MTTCVGSGASTLVMNVRRDTCEPPSSERARSRFAFTAVASIGEPSVNVASSRSVSVSVDPSSANSQSVASIGCRLNSSSSHSSRS
jgi:hypothetical protein